MLVVLRQFLNERSCYNAKHLVISYVRTNDMNDNDNDNDSGNIISDKTFYTHISTII